MKMPDRDTVLANGIRQRRTEYATHSTVIPAKRSASRDPGFLLFSGSRLALRLAGMTIFLLLKM
jgi:hypothetical protein